MAARFVEQVLAGVSPWLTQHATTGLCGNQFFNYTGEAARNYPDIQEGMATKQREKHHPSRACSCRLGRQQQHRWEFYSLPQRVGENE